MTKRYLVLDQNILRTPELVELVRSNGGAHFVLPDLAFLEMTKSSEWQRTLHDSLATLSTVPNRVHLAYSVNEALANELQSLRPVTGHLLFREATVFIRDLLLWVRTGRETDAFRRIQADPDNHKGSVISDHLNHVANKSQLAELIDGAKRIIPEQVQKQLRGASIGDSERLDVVHEIAKGLLPNILAEAGVNYNKARSFMKQRPMAFRYVLLKVLDCVNWISKGGFESFPEHKVSNEDLDHQYVLTSTFFHELLSRDGRVNESHKHLRLLLQRPI